mmetsp:Transcript_16388/g.28971  ORF Transcript_16388/g.28971 Transcript_16388/m.28971 type:complete len:80 (+) Transcript_16388:479-718(+)
MGKDSAFLWEQYLPLPTLILEAAQIIIYRSDWDCSIYSNKLLTNSNDDDVNNNNNSIPVERGASHTHTKCLIMTNLAAG